MKALKGIVFFIFCFTILFAHVSSAAMLDRWQGRSPLPTAEALRGITYGNGMFVAIGDRTIISSVDGATWTNKINGVDDGYPPSLLQGIAYGNNTFVIAAWSSIFRSSDSVNWTKTISQSSLNVKGVAYGNNMFVVVGEGGTIMTSPDGTSWTTRISGTTMSLRGITFGNSRFVAVGGKYDSGTKIYTNITLTSSDGINWTGTQRTASSTNWLLSVCYGNNMFVAVGQKGTLLTSTDGLAWTTKTSGTDCALEGITFGNNTFVAVGEKSWFGDYTYVTVASTDGSKWTVQKTTKTTDNRLYGITYAAGSFIAVGNGIIFKSSNGTSWTTMTTGTTKDLGSLVYGNGIFVAGGDGGIIVTSVDGVVWTPGTSGTDYTIDEIKFENNLFIARGSKYNSTTKTTSYRILTSTDGIIWTQRAAGNGFITDIMYANNIFVASGGIYVDSTKAYSYFILTSPDGAAWTQRTSGSSYSLGGVAYGNNTFVAMGRYYNDTTKAQGYTVLTSTDGLNWTQRSSGTVYYPYKVVFGNNTFVMVCDRYDAVTKTFMGTALSSSDGAGWTPGISGTFPPLLHMVYAENTFVAVGGSWDSNTKTDKYVILSSSNGADWTQRYSGTGYGFVGIDYVNKIFVALGMSVNYKSGGNSYKVVTSKYGVTWDASLNGTTNNVLYKAAYGSGNDTLVAVGSKGLIMQAYDFTETTNPHLAVAPASHGFGNIDVGSTSSPQAFTISENHFHIPLTLGNISITGADHSQFSLQNDNCSGKSVAGAQSCTLEVLFLPTSRGDKTATLSIQSNDPASPGNIALTGTGFVTQYTLAISKAGSGSGDVAGGGTYDNGTSHDITAIAATGSTFTGWSGDCAGTASPLSVLVDSAKTCTATFTLNQYALTVSKEGNGSGTVTGGGTYDYGTTHDITATASAGSNFTGWSGDCAGTASPLSVLVDSAKTCTATFALIDTTPPNAPVVTGLTPTNNTKPAWSWTTGGGGNGTYQCRFDSGAWSACASPFTPASALSEGAHTLNVQERDDAGNWSSSGSRTIVVDITKPLLTLSMLSDNAWTSNVTLNVSGRATDENGIGIVTVNSAEATLNPDGTFSHALTLATGANTITTAATDNAGNQSIDMRTINYDHNAPVLTITAPADNSVTKEETIPLTGTVDETATVTAKVNVNAPATVPLTGNAFDMTVTLEYGINTIELTAEDRAHNTVKVKRTVTFDNQNPSLSITEPNADLSTSQSHLLIKGAVTDLTIVTVTVTAGETVFHPDVADGKFEQSIDLATEGTNTVTVVATDAAGNTATARRNIIYMAAGDVDGSGTMNIVDALFVARHAAGLSVGIFYAEAADVNCDGTVNIVDALFIARKSAGLSVTGWCGL